MPTTITPDGLNPDEFYLDRLADEIIKFKSGKSARYPDPISVRDLVVVIEGYNILRIDELIQLLDSFNFVYNVAYDIAEAGHHIWIRGREIKEIAEKVSNDYEQRVGRMLNIKTISFNSPLEITFMGLGVALVIAVILSGGEFQISVTGIKAKLPPLGEGIGKLRKALGMTERKSLGSREEEKRKRQKLQEGEM